MNQDVKFKATDVELIEETGFIGFADNITEHYFWMQPEETDSGFDIRKEMIWLERDDQGWGGHGGSEWTISLSKSEFLIDTHHLDFMQCNQIIIEFDIDDVEFTRLVNLIKKVMSSCLTDLKINA